jgi:integrase
MARTLEKLTAVAVAKRAKPGRVSDGGGLYLNVLSATSKSWLFMWAVKGKRREMGLGPFPAITLKAAREKATEYRAMVAEGLDPIAERNRRLAKTFGECADLYIASMEGSWKNEKHKYQWRQTLTSYCTTIRARPIASISTEDVLGVLNPIWTTKAETASRLRNRLELVLDFARAKGWRDGENPARWRGHLKNLLPAPRRRDAVKHLPAMAYDDVPAFLTRLRTHEAMAARALEFTILTACRTGEALGATWAEIDLDKALWTVPGERMKANQQHIVPLSPAAIALLKPLKEAAHSKFVFPGQKALVHKGRPLGLGPLSNMAMEMLLRRMKVTDFTVHGFRSSFRDWCGDRTEFPREVAEQALAHKVGDSVEQAYRRSSAIEKRRRLMEAWAEHCEGAADAKVVALRR